MNPDVYFVAVLSIMVLALGLLRALRQRHEPGHAPRQAVTLRGAPPALVPDPKGLVRR